MKSKKGKETTANKNVRVEETKRKRLAMWDRTREETEEKGEISARGDGKRWQCVHDEGERDSVMERILKRILHEVAMCIPRNLFGHRIKTKEASSTLGCVYGASVQAMHTDTPPDAQVTCVKGRMVEKYVRMVMGLRSTVSFLCPIKEDGGLTWTPGANRIVKEDFNGVTTTESRAQSRAELDRRVRYMGYGVCSTWREIQTPLPMGWAIFFPGSTPHGGAACNVRNGAYRLHGYSGLRGDKRSNPEVFATHFPGEMTRRALGLQEKAQETLNQFDMTGLMLELENRIIIEDNKVNDKGVWQWEKVAEGD